MITTPTTFIVGAGASCIYGLPSGEQLWNRAAQLEPGSEVYRLLTQCGFDSNHLNEWITNLKRHPGGRSIDAFLTLRQHQPETVRLGRAVITALLGLSIARDWKQPERRIDWLQYLIEKSLEGVRDLESFRSRNKGLGFVTFNFDSIIEDRFLAALRSAFWTSDEKDLPPVHHVHGRLPSPPILPRKAKVVDQFDEAVSEWVNWVRQASQCINVVFDSEVDSAAQKAAHKLLSASTIACFMGFSYHRDNLLRIEARQRLMEKEVFGTAYGLKAGEQSTVKGRFFNQAIKLGGEEDDCVAVLRNFHIFRD